MVKVMSSNHYYFHERTAEFNSFITRDRQFGYSQPSTMNPAYSVLISCVTRRSSISAAAIGKSQLYFIVCSSTLHDTAHCFKLTQLLKAIQRKKLWNLNTELLKECKYTAALNHSLFLKSSYCLKCWKSVSKQNVNNAFSNNGMNKTFSEKSNLLSVVPNEPPKLFLKEWFLIDSSLFLTSTSFRNR